MLIDKAEINYDKNIKIINEEDIKFKFNEKNEENEKKNEKDTKEANSNSN